jgi:hypothetical protein
VLGSALAGSGRPPIVTAGTGMVTPGRCDLPRPVRRRGAEGILRSGLVMCLPPSVHDDGDHGFVPADPPLWGSQPRPIADIDRPRYFMS